MASKDFSKDRSEATDFTIGRFTYDAVVGMPAGDVLDLATRFGQAQTAGLQVDEQIVIFTEVIEMLLVPDSFTLFSTNMRNRDPVDMIEIDQVSDVIEWLIEQFGLRPTQPSSPSSTGQPPQEPGTDWTGTTSGEVSISAASPSTGS